MRTSCFYFFGGFTSVNLMFSSFLRFAIWQTSVFVIFSNNVNEASLMFVPFKKQDQLDIIQVFKYIKHNIQDVATFFIFGKHNELDIVRCPVNRKASGAKRSKHNVLIWLFF